MKDSFCKDLDVMKLHLNEINKIPLLSNEKEVELAKKAASGDKAARDLLVSSNMRFVVNVAKKYQNRGLDLEDLISEGYVGLSIIAVLIAWQLVRNRIERKTATAK